MFSNSLKAFGSHLLQRLAISAVGLVLLGSGSIANATQYTWLGGGASNNWFTGVSTAPLASNWAPGSPNMSSSDTALFSNSGTARPQPNVNNSVTLSGLSFTGTQQYQITFTNARSLTLSGTLSNSSSVQQVIGQNTSTTKGLIVGASGLTVDSGTAGIVVTNNLSGGSPGVLTKVGDGNLTLQTGGQFNVSRLTVNEGTVTAANGILGDVTVSSTTVGGGFVSNGDISQTLTVTAGTATVGGNVAGSATISGGTSVITGNVGGAYTQTGGVSTVGGQLGAGSISAGSLTITSFDDNFTQTGGSVNGVGVILQDGTGVQLGNGVFTQSSGTANLTGNSSGDTAFIQQTGGKIVFNRNQIAGGGITINGTGNVINNQLGGDVSITGTAVGNNVEFVSNLDLLSTGNFHLNFSKNAGFNNADQLKTDAQLTYGGTLALNLTTAGTAANYTQWTMFTFGTQTGTLSDITLAASLEPQYAGLNFFESSAGNYFDQKYGAGIWLSDWSTGGQRFIFNQSSGVLTVVPEPSTIVFAGIGMAMLGWHTWTRGRRNARMKLIEEHMRRAGEERGLA